MTAKAHFTLYVHVRTQRWYFKTHTVHHLFFNHGAHSCFQLDSSSNLLIKAQKCLFYFIFLDKELLLLYSIFIIVKQSALTENSHTHALTHKRLIKTVQFSLGQHFYIKKEVASTSPIDMPITSLNKALIQMCSHPAVHGLIMKLSSEKEKH